MAAPIGSHLAILKCSKGHILKTAEEIFMKLVAKWSAPQGIAFKVYNSFVRISLYAFMHEPEMMRFCLLFPCLRNLQVFRGQI